jgi:hypothetical protein
VCVCVCACFMMEAGFAVLRIKPKASHMLGKSSTSELRPKSPPIS